MRREIRHKLSTRFLAAAALVTAYLVGTIGIWSLAPPTKARAAEDKKSTDSKRKRERRGRRGYDVQERSIRKDDSPPSGGAPGVPGGGIGAKPEPGPDAPPRREP